MKISLLLTIIFISSQAVFGQFSGQNELASKIGYSNGGKLADFDNDGDPDLVISLYYTDRLYYYENVGGTFIFGVTISSDFDGPSRVSAADFNGDGFIDVIASATDDLAWFANNGDGTFEEKVVIDNDVGPVNDLYPADVDGDGDFDLLTSESYQLYYYENLDEGDFAVKYAFFDEPESSKSVCTIDLDDDGDLDVIGTSFSNEVSYYENLGVAGFADLEVLFTLPSVRRLRSGDLDGDGDDDLMALGYDKVQWCENLGLGVLEDPVLITEAIIGAGKMEIIDSDLDGDLDVFFSISGDDGKIVWLENEGPGTFAAPEDIALDIPNN